MLLVYLRSDGKRFNQPQVIKYKLIPAMFFSVCALFIQQFYFGCMNMQQPHASAICGLLKVLIRRTKQLPTPATLFC